MKQKRPFFEIASWIFGILGATAAILSAFFTNFYSKSEEAPIKKNTTTIEGTKNNIAIAGDGGSATINLSTNTDIIEIEELKASIDRLRKTGINMKIDKSPNKEWASAEKLLSRSIELLKTNDLATARNLLVLTKSTFTDAIERSEEEAAMREVKELEISSKRISDAFKSVIEAQQSLRNNLSNEEQAEVDVAFDKLALITMEIGNKENETSTLKKLNEIKSTLIKYQKQK